MDVEDPNSATLKAYEKFYKAYLRQTPSGYTESHQPLLRWIDKTIESAPANAHVFEIGSATPREANYFRSNGLRVTCSDAVGGFVSHLRRSGEKEALKFNVLTDNFSLKYDVIFANAVFPHFTENELKNAFSKISGSLEPGKIFAFSVKLGTGETWIQEKFNAKRYIHYWQPEELYAKVKEAGFKIIYTEAGTVGDVPTHIWINITAVKI